jgi:hypothetical protein
MNLWAIFSSAVVALRKGGQIYRDTFKPAAVQLGKAFGSLARLVNVLLLPLTLLMDFVERFCEGLRVQKKKWLNSMQREALTESGDIQ